MSKHEEIQKLAKEYFGQNPNAPKCTIYVLENTDQLADSKQISRLYGPPLGVDNGNWPTSRSLINLWSEIYEHQDHPFDGDLRMEHLMTIDLNDVPAFSPGLRKQFVAMSVFVSSASYNEGYNEDNDDFHVAFLTQAHLDSGWFEGQIPVRVRDQEPQALAIHAVEIPTNAYHGAETEELRKLHNLIFNANVLNGTEIWLQNDPDEYGFYDDYDDYDVYGDDEDNGDEHSTVEIKPPYDIPEQGAPALGSAGVGFIMQLTDEFGLNLGDSGSLYVYSWGAFWQCY